MITDFMGKELENLQNNGLYNSIRIINTALDSWISVNDKKALDMCSNNYLGLANHPVLKEAAKKGIDKYGVGPAAVRSIAGTTDRHIELEKKLAAFKNVKGTLFLQSGYCANVGVIPTLVGDDDLIFSDELNHASIIDGCRLSRAEIVRYAHVDMNDLEDKLKASVSKKCRKIVISDGVFSMDGDIAPLKEITDIAHNYDAMVYIDDAHGEGVLGKNGAGIVDHFNLHSIVDVEVGTLSKAFGIVGGFAAGKETMILYLKQKVRPFLFSSSTTLADTEAAISAVDLLIKSNDLVTKLWDNAKYFQNIMLSKGFDIGKTKTPITPIMLGDAVVAQTFSKKLLEKGIFTQSIGFPTVPKGKARLRVMIHAIHSKDDLDFAAQAFYDVGKELNIVGK